MENKKDEEEKQQINSEEIQFPNDPIDIGQSTYTLEDKIDWGISTTADDSARSKPIKAIPSPAVEAGTYRFILVAGALGIGSAQVNSANFQIGDDMAKPQANFSRGTFQNSKVVFYVSWFNITVDQLGQSTTGFHSNDISCS